MPTKDLLGGWEYQIGPGEGNRANPRLPFDRPAPRSLSTGYPEPPEMAGEMNRNARRRDQSLI
jgi:hypothetical protein